MSRIFRSWGFSPGRGDTSKTSSEIRRDKKLAKVPVAIFIHSRPLETGLVMNSVAKYQPEKLYVIADGPRHDYPGEAEACHEARELFAQVGWDCDIQRRFRSENLGSGASVKEGLDWVFSIEDSLIILEDDTVPNPMFFELCEELLPKYAEDPRIGMISGSRVVQEPSPYRSSYTFSRVPITWGWASWSRAWKGLDWDMEWRELRELKTLKKISLNRKHFYYWRWVLALLDSKEVDAWDWQWNLSLAIAQQYTVVPSVNLVENIGFGARATHTFGIPKGLEATGATPSRYVAGQNVVPLNRGYERRLIKRFLPDRRPERLLAKFLFQKVVREPRDFLYLLFVKKIVRETPS